MKSIISSQALLLMRPYKPILIGSAAYGNVHANDIDMLIRVDVEKLGEVEGQLTALGFSQQVPDPETLDPPGPIEVADRTTVVEVVSSIDDAAPSTPAAEPS